MTREVPQPTSTLNIDFWMKPRIVTARQLYYLPTLLVLAGKIIYEYT